jgi:hypothetical protein
VRPVLGYYAHHQGRGHVHRALAIAPHLRTPMTLLTSAEVPQRDGDGGQLTVRTLPLDVPATAAERGRADAVRLPTVLHHAPIGARGLRQRVAAMATFVAEVDPAAVVVDVSVEMTLLLRLAGVAPVVVRQHGDRSDPPHRAAYDAAAALLAPWPAWFESEDVDRELRDRTWYVGAFSHVAKEPIDRDTACARAGLDPQQRNVVVLGGAGGSEVTVADVGAAAHATPGWRWTLAGAPAATSASDVDGYLDVRGWVDDPWPLLRAADVVVSHAGHNAVSDAAAACARLIVVPADRPHDEQRAKARRLAEVGAATVVPDWPPADRWPGLLERAADSDPDVLRRLVDGHGAARAATALDGLVEELAS